MTMMIAKNRVVTIEYDLTDETGALLDSTKDQGPLSFIQGIGNIIPGLESALEGKKKGDAVKASIPPEMAYGLRDEALVQVVSKDQFDTSEDIKVGMQFEAEVENGQVVMFNVLKVDKDKITLDGNHPLAGSLLNFDVKIVDIRDASAEELQHGHVHGPGGHHHHHHHHHD